MIHIYIAIGVLFKLGCRDSENEEKWEEGEDSNRVYSGTEQILGRPAVVNVYNVVGYKDLPEMAIKEIKYKENEFFGERIKIEIIIGKEGREMVKSLAT